MTVHFLRFELVEVSITQINPERNSGICHGDDRGCTKRRGSNLKRQFGPIKLSEKLRVMTENGGGFSFYPHGFGINAQAIRHELPRKKAPTIVLTHARIPREARIDSAGGVEKYGFHQ